MPAETIDFSKFALSGGPVYSLARRIGLMHGDVGVFRTGVALGFSLWFVLLLLALVEGRYANVFSLEICAVHARLLLVIPLLFLADGLMAPRIQGFCTSQVKNGILNPEDVARMDAHAQKFIRLHDSWIPESILLGITLLATVLAPGTVLLDLSDYLLPSADSGSTALVHIWFWYVCLPILKFITLRWLWRYALWVAMIWLFSRRNLMLEAAHPDQAGGIGQIITVQQQVAPVLLALSVMGSAVLAEAFSTGQADLSLIYSYSIFAVLLGTVVMLGPLLFFSDSLYQARVQGGAHYTNLGARYVRRFNARWMDQRNVQDEDLLGSADIQSLADLQNSFDGVRNMRSVLVNNRILLLIIWAGAGPFLPLFLFVYPMNQILQGFFGRLLGF